MLLDELPLAVIKRINMKLKTLIIIIIYFLIRINVSAQNETCFPLKPIEYDKLQEQLIGNWEYDYSFNSDSVFKIDGNYFEIGYVPYRIEFNTTSKSENKKLEKKCPELINFREKSCLKDLSFWVDDKGIMRYPLLVSNDVDKTGCLIECKLELMDVFDYSGNDFVTIISLSKGILIISNYQGDKRNDYHVFVKK